METIEFKPLKQINIDVTTSTFPFGKFSILLYLRNSSYGIYIRRCGVAGFTTGANKGCLLPVSWEIPSYLKFDIDTMSYYPTFNDKRHVTFETAKHNFDDKNSLWLPTDDFLNNSKPLEISCDFNAAFTSLIVGQQTGNEQRIDNNLYVKPKQVITEETKISLVRELVELFVKEYANNTSKHVEVFGDRNGQNRSPNASQTSYEQIKQVLAEHKWSCKINVADTNQDHKTRHFAIEELLSEAQTNYPKVRINGNKCKYLIYSIQNTPITKDWKKNKSSEESDAIPQEKATHLSDCFDYLIYCKFAKLVGIQQTTYLDPLFI